jgi:nicotinamide-nucleotide amidase
MSPAEPPPTPATRCLHLLQSAGATLATAESLTAGLVASTLAEVPGASDVLRGGLVAYATDVKVSVLGVDARIVDRYGVVSAPCAEAMAVAARDLFGATWAVSTTGVAGPDRQDDKPPGTVFVAVAGPATGGTSPAVHVEQLALAGSRQQIRDGTVVALLDLLAETLARATGTPMR